MKLAFVTDTAVLSPTEIEDVIEQYQSNIQELEDASIPVNRSQYLWLDGIWLRYGGERHPFLEDGAYDAVIQIFGSVAKATVALVTYTTSAPALGWNQTMNHYVQQCPQKELLGIVLSIIKRTGWTPDPKSPAGLLGCTYSPPGEYKCKSVYVDGLRGEIDATIYNKEYKYLYEWEVVALLRYMKRYSRVIDGVWTTDWPDK